MSLGTGDYHLVTSNSSKYDIGSILREGVDKVINRKKGIYEVSDKPTKSGSLIIPHNMVETISKIPHTQRIYALKMMLISNEYHSSSCKNELSKKYSKDIIQYYLISKKYNAWNSGSIFQMVDKTIFDCDKKNGGVMHEDIPESWLQINEEAKTCLMSVRRRERLKLFYKNKKKKAWCSFNTLSLASSEVSFYNYDKYRSISSVSSSLQSSVADVSESSSAGPPILTEIQYFESTVIIPSSVCDMEKVAFSDWKIGEKVYFTLIESGSRYQGTLRWLGSVNGTDSAAVEIVSLRSNDPLIVHQCSWELILTMHIIIIISSSTSVVLVRLSTINKSFINYSAVMPHFVTMFGSIADRALASRIFDDAEKIDDPKFQDSLVSNCPAPFLSDISLKLIAQSQNDANKLKSVTSLINRIPSSQNVDLLKIAKHCLIHKKEDLFKLVIGKCGDRNCHLANGETFVTDLIRGTTEETVINTVIGTKLFNINKPNNNNETALTLACGRLLLDTVRILVDLGCDIDHDNGKAMDIVFARKKSSNDVDTLKKVIEIIEMLRIATKPDINVCTICMERKINTAFNCGHNSCKVCADKLSVCHFCRETVTHRLSIYLAS